MSADKRSELDKLIAVADAARVLRVAAHDPKATTSEVMRAEHGLWAKLDELDGRATETPATIWKKGKRDS